MKNTNKGYESQSRVAIALGDPAGIGIEVTLKALGNDYLPKDMHPLLVGCKQNVEIIFSKLKSKGVKNLADPSKLDFEDIPFQGELEEGQANKKTGEASFTWLTRATEIVLNKNAKALVTAPIAKFAWHAAGYCYPGQTERLAELSSVRSPSMLFTAKSPNTNWRFNTLLATTHIPFSDIPGALSPELIMKKLDTLLTFCEKFRKNPILSIAGLNPHAGEHGKIGSEEMKWLIPTLNSWRKKHPNILLTGPIPPDTCWISAAKAWEGNKEKSCPDGILALYHDQGLIPVKIIAFDHAVNTTLGLPFIRTSPDHGTGLDIAGHGIAKAESMLSAIQTAWEL